MLLVCQVSIEGRLFLATCFVLLMVNKFGEGTVGLARRATEKVRPLWGVVIFSTLMVLLVGPFEGKRSHITTTTNSLHPHPPPCRHFESHEASLLIVFSAFLDSLSVPNTSFDPHRPLITHHGGKKTTESPAPLNTARLLLLAVPRPLVLVLAHHARHHLHLQ